MKLTAEQSWALQYRRDPEVLRRAKETIEKHGAVVQLCLDTMEECARRLTEVKR